MFFMILLAVVLKASIQGQPQCPATHPNVYYNGQYCCLSDKEKVYPPAGETCDGSEIQRDSTCCEGDKFVRCLTGNCENSDSVERQPKCPATHPNVYLNGRYCCMSDKEKVHLPSGYKCDGSEIQRNSVCCEGNKYVKCPTENCENSDRFEISCTGRQFRCEDALQCIDINSECDGHVDCNDQSDEADCEGTNIAKYGIATQKSTAYDGLASTAIDGNKIGIFSINGVPACTATKESTSPQWWKLAFTTVVQVDLLKIWNRMGTASYRIDGVKVYLDENLCGTIKYEEYKNPYRIDCGAKDIRTVSIIKEYNMMLSEMALTLCEVEVFSKKTPKVCKAGEVLHGSTFPKEVIEGSAVTVTCDKGFVVEGEWQQICQNGTFNNGFHSLCVKIDIDRHCSIKAVDGFIKSVCQDGSKRTLKCLKTDVTYDVVVVENGPTQMSEACPNDPKFYQACGGTSRPNSIADNLLCEKFVCEKEVYVETSYCAQGEEKSCSNVEVEEICANHNVTSSKKCNEICDDDKHCRDEAECNGFRYGKFCYWYNWYYNIQTISLIDWYDWEYHCQLWAPYQYRRGREDFLRAYDGPVCQHTLSNFMTPIFNFTRCAVFKYDHDVRVKAWWLSSSEIPYCKNMMDQTNCTDLSRVALSCMVDGYKTNVSKFAICHGRSDVRICDNGIENNCKLLSPSCFVHKHRLCDGIIDCIDQSDETALECNEMTKTRCVRVFGNESLPIPLKWLGDGIDDCLSLIDETTDWPTCGSGVTRRYVLNNDSCTDDFLCLNSETKFIPENQLCDMIDTCGNENLICKLSKERPNLFTSMIKDVKRKIMPYCLRGLQSIQKMAKQCSMSSFSFPPKETFGVSNLRTFLAPKKLYNCDYTFGEMYVLLSCAGNCTASSCPLSRPLKYDSCGGQYPNRVFTVTGMDYLTFVTPRQGSYNNDYFLCKNNRCVTYDKVCNLVDDCGDGSDEEACTNQFRCNATNTTIPKWQRCDGHIDCEDLSDECNRDCGKEIIDGLILKISAWLIGFLAATFNICIITSSLMSLKDVGTSMGLLNKLLIMLISIGDFLVGGYLFAISVIDLVCGASYCSKQTIWRSSAYCTILGIASTFGSQMSLFSMTCLSLARLFGIKNAMNRSDDLSPKSHSKIVSILFAIAMSAASIAIVPILPQFEDFFVNGMRYDESNPMFIGFPNKEVHHQIIQAFYGRTMKDYKAINWKTVLQLIDAMFTSTYGGLYRRKVDFYGNDGVCLFKYFVTKEDPQRLYSWTILAINFFCFIIITVSYIIINLVSVKSSKVIRNRQINQRNRRMQRKISMIIATDFCCWIPFVLICCLHSLSVLDATPWYSFFSVVVLPINSVINPLLFDSTVTKQIAKPIRSVRKTIALSFSSLRKRNDCGYPPTNADVQIRDQPC